MKQGFDYDEALRKTEETIPKVNEALEELAKLLHSSNSANAWGLSLDDVILLPELRTLSVAPGVSWPGKVKEYLLKNCEAAGVQTYFQYAH